MSGPFDPEKMPAWAERALRKAGDATGRYIRTEVGRDESGSSAIALGAGTFVAPLPRGWSFQPGEAYSGTLTTREGFDIAYHLDSYEDAEAARGGQRLMSYVDEPELRAEVRTPDDILKDFLIWVPGENAIGRDIIWKCLEPAARTHVRELVLRCPIVTAQMADHRVDIAHAVGEWLNLGRFSPDLTALDRVAHTDKLERVNFENTVLMRVPRHWKCEVNSIEEGRKLFAVDEPEDRETLWVASRRLRLAPDASQATMESLRDEAADDVWAQMTGDSKRRLITKRRETIEEGDSLFTLVSEEEERGETLRRKTWVRIGLRDGAIVWAPIHLVTAKQFLDDPAQIESEAIADREVRNAILMAPEEAGESG